MENNSSRRRDESGRMKTCGAGGQEKETETTENVILVANKPSLQRLRERLPLQNWPTESLLKMPRHNVLPIVSREGRMPTTIVEISSSEIGLV